MTPISILTWNELVDDNVGDKAAAIVLQRILDAPWLECLGQPSWQDGGVVRVAGWTEVFRMFVEGVSRDLHPRQGTSKSGTLNAPTNLLIERLDEDDRLHRKTAQVANHALFEALPDRHYAAAQRIATSIPQDVWPDRSVLDDSGAALYAMMTIGDYIHEYIRLLFIEIYAGDVAEPHCNYFRDQLGWFLAGLLPCGWEGAWPEGRMRVF